MLSASRERGPSASDWWRCSTAMSLRWGATEWAHLSLRTKDPGKSQDTTLRRDPGRTSRLPSLLRNGSNSPQSWQQ